MCIVWDRVFGCGHYIATDMWMKCKTFTTTNDCEGDTVVQKFVPRRCWLCSARSRSGRDSLGYLDVGVSGDVEAAVTADQLGRMLGPIDIEAARNNLIPTVRPRRNVERANTIGATGRTNNGGYLIDRAGTVATISNSENAPLLSTAGSFGKSHPVEAEEKSARSAKTPYMLKKAEDLVQGIREFLGPNALMEPVSPKKPAAREGRSVSEGGPVQRNMNLEFGHRKV